MSTVLINQTVIKVTIRIFKFYLSRLEKAFVIGSTQVKIDTEKEAKKGNIAYIPQIMYINIRGEVI